MKCKVLWVCALFALAVAATPGQTKNSMSGKCGKPDAQSIPAGDRDGHLFTLQTGKCESMGEIGGAKSKEGAFSEHTDTMGSRVKAWGVYVETFDSGDKVFYNYQTHAKVENGALVSGGNTYQISGGTGKMKGIKGSGTCKLTGTPEGGLVYRCTGQYTLAKISAEK
jgi:hypothetical protein